MALSVFVFVHGVGCQSKSSDSANVVDSAVEGDVCDPVDGPTGTVVGEADCTDGICEVPAGAFWMGSATPEAPERCPVREITVSAFAMDQTEVTLEAWALCVEAGVCVEASEACESEGLSKTPEQHPVTCVDHSAATAYCAWAEGRLPTEAEWEKAARGTDGPPYPWGDDHLDCLHANYRFSASYCNLGVIEVGTYVDYPSPYGLFDMTGNAWEWISDGYLEGYYSASGSTDPTGTDCGEECAFRVLRGGAYNTTEDTLHTAARSFGRPDVSDDNIGFRCAYDRD